MVTKLKLTATTVFVVTSYRGTLKLVQINLI